MTDQPVAAAPVSPAALTFLRTARQGLANAYAAVSPDDRYISAHMAALQGASAVAVARGVYVVGRGKPRSVWELLPKAAPELAEWSPYFAASASLRAATEAGLPRAVAAREAEELLQNVDTFLLHVESALGVSVQAPLPLGPLEV